MSEPIAWTHTNGKRIATWQCPKCNCVYADAISFCHLCYNNATAAVAAGAWFGAESPTPPSILAEATTLINGDRHADYGDYNVEAPLVAAGWEALRRGGPITPRHVPLMMMWLKMVRESHKPKADNRVDISGYLQLLERMQATL